MAKLDEDKQHNIEILKSLNNAIEKGAWGNNLFFQAMLKKLMEIRDRFKRETNLTDEMLEKGSASPATLLGRVAKRSGFIEVFIVLYNADGDNIPKWENTLTTISSHVISRPIYRDETEAKAVLRAASNRSNEAYASVFIHEEDIMKPPSEACPHDRYGNEILIVREGAITRENLHRFVHKTGNYEFENNKLVWQAATEFL